MVSRYSPSRTRACRSAMPRIRATSASASARSSFSYAVNARLFRMVISMGAASCAVAISSAAANCSWACAYEPLTSSTRASVIRWLARISGGAASAYSAPGAAWVSASAASPRHRWKMASRRWLRASRYRSACSSAHMLTDLAIRPCSATRPSRPSTSPVTSSARFSRSVQPCRRAVRSARRAGPATDRKSSAVRSSRSSSSAARDSRLTPAWSRDGAPVSGPCTAESIALMADPFGR
jgi:hypothetical protein